MEDVLVPLLIFGAPERRRREITELLLPAAVPGSAGQRLAFAAVLARQQISSREQAELKIIREAAPRFVDPRDLAANAPSLHRIYAGLEEDVKATVQFGTDSHDSKREPKQKPKEGSEAASDEPARKEATAGRKG